MKGKYTSANGLFMRINLKTLFKNAKQFYSLRFCFNIYILYILY